MFKIIIRFIFLLSVMFCFVTYSKKYESINIQTTNKVLQKELQQMVKKYIYSQKTVNEQQILTVITKYLTQHHYLQSSVTIQKSNSKALNFKVENPVQYFFIFRGNQKVNTLTLYSLIHKNDFFATPYIAETAMKKIQEYYKKNAYYKIQIQTNIKKQISENKAYIRLSIQEGKKFIIQNINFSGSLSQDSKFYKNLLKNHPNSIFKLKYFEEKKVQLYLQSIVHYLRQIGYVQAQLYHQDISFNDNMVTLNIILKEGSAVRIQEILVKGNQHILSKEIKDTLQVKKGDILNIIKIQNGIQKILQLYKDKNFLKVKIDQEHLIHIHPSFQTARIYVNIQENDITFLKNLLVKGHKDIQPDYIRLMSNFKKEEKITQHKIDQATYFLEDSGLFSIVDIDFTPQKKDSLTIKVQEGLFGFFRFKLGANTKHKFSTQMNLDIDKKNLWGYNHSDFLLNTELSTNIQLLYNIINTPVAQRNLFPKKLPLLNLLPYNISTSYIHSYLWNSRFNGKVTYTHKNEIFSLDDTQIDWIRSHHLSFNVDRKLNNTSHLNWRLWNIELGRSYTQKFLLDPELNKKTMTTSFHQEQVIAEMGFDVKVDRRDNILFPKKGFYFDFKTDYSNPYIGAHKDIHFVSTEMKSRYYLSFWKLVFAHAVSGGVIQNLGNGKIPVRRYFILGGLNSLRGFDGKMQGDRIPRVSEFAINSPIEMKPFSSYYFLLKQEIRFPIYRDFLNGALFYDAGGVFLTSKGTRIFSFGHSVGVGIHNMTGLGPLVINLGFKIKPQPQENIFHLSWSIGAF